MVKILGISGSLRKNSYNSGLLRKIKELLPKGFKMEVYNLSKLPLYNTDLEKPHFPKEVLNFKRKIKGVDYLLISTPEYSHSLSGVLKNALDWASRPYDETMPTIKKKTFIMGVSTGRLGTRRAQRDLRKILIPLRNQVIKTPRLYINFAEEKFNKEGNLTDLKTIKKLKELVKKIK